MKTFLSGFLLQSSVYWFLLGVLVGAALDFLWWRTGIGKYEKKLDVFEHYHWGLVLIIFMKKLLRFYGGFLSFAGIGFTLILAEITQEHPFAFRSDHQTSSTIIGIILFVLLFLI